VITVSTSSTDTSSQMFALFMPFIEGFVNESLLLQPMQHFIQPHFMQLADVTSLFLFVAAFIS